MAGQVPNQKRKEEEEKKEEKILKAKQVPKQIEQKKSEAALKEMDIRTTQKVDAGKLVADYLNPDFLKQGIGPSSISKILTRNAVPIKGLSKEQAETRVARAYVRDNILGYLPPDMKPSQKEVERSMGTVAAFVFDLSNTNQRKETKKLG